MIVKLKLKLKLVLVSLLVFVNSFSCDKYGITGFLPENDMYIGTDKLISSDMNKKIFDEIIDKVERVYSPIVADNGAELRIIRDWESGEVNAYAKRSGKIWEIRMLGGLARHPLITQEGLAIVICHELGHHLGGAPKKKRLFVLKSWASNEGQADYWSTLKCFRRVNSEDNNIEIISKMKIDEEAKRVCSEVWDTEEEVALCLRISHGIKKLSVVLNKGKDVSF